MEDANRKKDMILVSGFNVYPNEVEDVVAKHPGVFEVAAVGVPDAESGEVAKLYVVKKDSALTGADVFAFCKEQLTGSSAPGSSSSAPSCRRPTSARFCGARCATK